MEGKVIGAVFTTLAIVFAGVSGGNFNAEAEEVLPEDDSPLNQFSSSFDILDRLIELPEPEQPARIEVTLLDPTQLQIESERLEVEGLRELEGISSDSDIGLKNFDGTILMGNSSEITGSSTGFYSEGVNVNSSTDVEIDTETSLINASDVANNEYTLEASQVRIEGQENDTVIEKSDTELEISAFRGNIEFRPEDLAMVFDGEVGEVSAGSASFGGN